MIHSQYFMGTLNNNIADFPMGSITPRRSSLSVIGAHKEQPDFESYQLS